MKFNHEKCVKLNKPTFLERWRFKVAMMKKGHSSVYWNQFMENELGTGCYYCAICGSFWAADEEPVGSSYNPLRVK